MYDQTNLETNKNKKEPRLRPRLRPERKDKIRQIGLLHIYNEEYLKDQKENDDRLTLKDFDCYFT